MSRLFLLFFILIPFLSGAQNKSGKHSVGLQWEIPIQFGVRYDVQIAKPISAGVQIGILSEPNSSIILNVLEAFDSDPVLLDLINNSFQLGLILEQDINYHFGKNYAGIFFQQAFLKGSETPYEVVELALDEDLSTFPRRGTRNQVVETELELQSSLLQVGLLYGRKFPLNASSEIFSEFSFSMNASSNSSISSQQRDLSLLNQELDELLSTFYSDNVYLPSLTIGWRKFF